MNDLLGLNFNDSGNTGLQSSGGAGYNSANIFGVPNTTSPTTITGFGGDSFASELGGMYASQPMAPAPPSLPNPYAASAQQLSQANDLFGGLNLGAGLTSSGYASPPEVFLYTQIF